GFAWCGARDWGWRLRLRQDLLVFEAGGGETTLAACFARGERLLSGVELTGKRVTTNVATVHEPGHPEPWIIALSEAPTVHRAFDYGLGWGIEIVFTQMTKRHPLAGRAERDGVADLALAVGDQHAVDQQLHELPLAREVGAGQARPNPPAEVGGRGRPAGELGPPVHLRLQLIGLPTQRLEPLLQRLSAA